MSRLAMVVGSMDNCMDNCTTPLIVGIVFLIVMIVTFVTAVGSQSRGRETGLAPVWEGCRTDP